MDGDDAEGTHHLSTLLCIHAYDHIEDIPIISTHPEEEGDMMSEAEE